MFQNLSTRLLGVLDRLRGRGALTEEDVKAALREVRIALLEADVALPVVKQFIQEVQEQAVGQDIIRSVSPGQMVVKIVHDHLVRILGEENVPLSFSQRPPAVFLMVGLQGSGKTTTTAKLAYFLTKTHQKKVLVASLDVYRPAAQEQLEILARQANVTSLPIVPGEKPLTIAKRALDAAVLYDVLILDSAGRLHIDADLMEELQAVKALAKPVETILVADSMTGQDAVVSAGAFNEQIGLTGLVLTRVDGDARGGAALSMRHVTGCPIKFLGMGEKIDQLEVFQPDRIARRLLDMGDVLSFVEKAVQMVDQEEAEKTAKRLQKGIFDLNDMEKQLQQMLKMGGIGSFLGMLPGLGKIKDKLDEAGMDDRIIRRQMAIIRSMTKAERRDWKILNASRKKRVAFGSGTEVSDVNRLLKQFEQMQQMMKKMSKMGPQGMKGLMRGGLGGLFR